MTDKHIKQVRLQPKYRRLSKGKKVVPELRINGEWLMACGFVAGTCVEITIKEKELIIKPLS